MAIRKRRTGAVVKETANVRNSSQIRVMSKAVVDYSGDYMHLLTKAQDSKQLIDPFATMYSGAAKHAILEPMFPFKELITIYLESSILRQCAEAYKVNIESYGNVWEYIGPAGQQQDEPAKKEKAILSSVLDRLSCINSLIETRELSRIDYEVLGWRCFEVARDQKGRVTLFDYVPASTVRMTKKDKTEVEVSVEYTDPDTGKISTDKISRTFRRFVQVDPTSQRKTFFKEFGDPRAIDPETGDENTTLKVEDQATEIYVDAQYVPGHVYGLPRWIGQIPCILGSKEAEIVNLNFFRDNAIPALAVLVSGGSLTQESFDKIQEYILAVKGQKSMHRVMVIEAAADDGAGSIDHSQPAPKIDMKPMISERQQEGLFQEYDEKNAGKVRSAFRLPPIFIGRAEDYTRASAFASMQTAEDQIFGPERMRFDMLVNSKVLNTYKPVYWKYKSMGAPLSDPDSIAKILGSLGKEGALTPNIVIKVANQILDIDMQIIDQKWGDIPFEITTSLVRSGNVIEGFDEFVKEVADKTKPENQKPVKDSGNIAEDEVKSFVRKELADMAEELRDFVTDSVQSFATRS